MIAQAAAARMRPRYETPISERMRASSRERRARDAVRLDESRWSARIREGAECGGRIAEELSDRRPDGREGNRCGGSRGDRLAERRGEVLAERTVIGMDPRTLGPAVRLDVRDRMWTVARRLELRIGQRRGGRSGELNQRDNERQEPQMQFAQPHERDGNTG